MTLDKIIRIKVTGNNVNNYLKRVIKRKINFIKVIPITKKELDIILKYNEYLKLLEYKTIYEITIVENLGILKIKENLNKNKILLIFIILGLLLIYNLSNIIFKVEVIHHDKFIRELVANELTRHDIKKYTYKKSYQELERIEDKILEDNKDVLEWLEIIINGTHLSVRVEERIIKDDKDKYEHQSIISKKNAVIKRINAKSGEVIREEDTYVKKGDTIISGFITLPNNTKVPTMAEGEVYGEVWYEVDIDYPFVYQESNLTGKSKTGLTIKFFNKEINLFNNANYKSFSSKNKVLFQDNFLNLQIIKEKRYEMIIKDEVYTEELVQSKAISYIKEKLMKDNKDIKDVSNIKVLSKSTDYDSVHFNFFVTTLESIGEVMTINEEDILPPS